MGRSREWVKSRAGLQIAALQCPTPWRIRRSWNGLKIADGETKGEIEAIFDSVSQHDQAVTDATGRAGRYGVNGERVHAHAVSDLAPFCNLPCANNLRALFLNVASELVSDNRVHCENGFLTGLHSRSQRKCQSSHTT